MSTARHIRHLHHKASFSYPISLSQRIYSTLIGPVVVVALMYIAIRFLTFLQPDFTSSISLNTLLWATLATLSRLALAYAFAVIVAIPLALLCTRNRFFEAVLLPIFDIFESIPILALFPVVLLLFIQFGNLSGAAVFILFLSMLWNIVFTLVGGLKIIPKDITYAAQVFGLRRFAYLREVLLPAIFPELVTGSILAFAQGWNLIIVAEVLHTYIPGGTSAQDLFGIGSIMVQSAAGAQNGIFLTATILMVVVIALLNFFVWQKLLRYAERFRFE